MAKSKKIITSEDLQSEFLKQNSNMYDEMLKEGVDITKVDEVDVENAKYWISTGSLLLDASITNSYIGKDGKPRLGVVGGKIMSMSGEESTGKSILAAHILKSAQQMNAFCVYIDGEQAVNKKLFSDIGVDFSKEKLVYSECNVVEKNFQTIEKVMEKIGTSKYPDRLGVVVWDSLASTTTLDELEAQYGEKSYGFLAKRMSEGFRKIIRNLRKYNISLIFTNQLRQNMKMQNKFDDPFIEPGGNALPFYSSLSLRLLKPTKGDRILNAKGQQIGTNIRVRFKKNRYGPPQEDLRFGLYFGRGIDDDTNLYYWLKDKKFLAKRKDQSTLKIPFLDEELKFPTRDWKRILTENELKVKLQNFVMDEIRIDLNSDDFYDSAEDMDETINNLGENSEEDDNDEKVEFSDEK